jgi:hypothetical protein
MPVKAMAAADAIVMAAAGCGGGTRAHSAGSTAPSPEGGRTGTGAAPAATESNPPGDIPDNTAYVAFRPPTVLYEVKVPKGWVRTELPTGASYTDKADTVRRKGGTAVRPVYRFDSAPDPVTGKIVRDEAERYEFYKAGHESVLTLSGPVGADNVDPWMAISASFRWLK